jgi:hypothetical protein
VWRPLTPISCWFCSKPTSMGRRNVSTVRRLFLWNYEEFEETKPNLRVNSSSYTFRERLFVFFFLVIVFVVFFVVEVHCFPIKYLPLPLSFFRIIRSKQENLSHKKEHWKIMIKLFKYKIQVFSSMNISNKYSFYLSISSSNISS